MSSALETCLGFNASLKKCHLQVFMPVQFKNFNIFKPLLASRHVVQLKVVLLSIHNYGTLYIKLEPRTKQFPHFPLFIQISPEDNYQLELWIFWSY